MQNALKTVKNRSKTPKNDEKPCENIPKALKTSLDTSESADEVYIEQFDPCGDDAHIGLMFQNDFRWVKFFMVRIRRRRF